MNKKDLMFYLQFQKTDNYINIGIFIVWYMSKVKPVNIQSSIEEAIVNEFESMLENNSDDILLKQLINLNKKRIKVRDVDLDLLVKELER